MKEAGIGTERLAHRDKRRGEDIDQKNQSAEETKPVVIEPEVDVNMEESCSEQDEDGESKVEHVKRKKEDLDVDLEEQGEINKIKKSLHLKTEAYGDYLEWFAKFWKKNIKSA